MAMMDVNGVAIAYEVIGDRARSAAITPGGRFSKDGDGIRELAVALAAHNFRVLIYDRPNCGESDICFAGVNESRQNTDTLADLLRALDFGPTMLIGGSGGARENLLCAIHHPDVVERVFVLSLSGGGIGIATLPITYCAESAMAAHWHGMAGVADLPMWQEQVSRNTGNRARFEALDTANFIATMRSWSDAYLPEAGVPIPCVSAAELAGIAVPVMVLRSGVSDLHHSRATSETVAAMIPYAQLAELPWDDGEWMARLAETLGGGRGLFCNWPLLLPQILAFSGQ